MGKPCRLTAILGTVAALTAANCGKDSDVRDLDTRAVVIGIVVSDGLGFHGLGHTARQDSDEGKTYPAELFPEEDALIPPEQQISAEFARRFIHLSADEYRRERFDPARFPRHNPNNPIHLFQQYAVTAQGYTAIAEKLLAEYL